MPKKVTKELKESARNLFFDSDLSLKEIAAQLDLPYSTVAKWSSSGNWVTAKDEFKAERIRKKREQVNKDYQDLQELGDKAIVLSAYKLLDQINKKISGDKHKTNDLLNLCTSLEKLQNIIRTSLSLDKMYDMDSSSIKELNDILTKQFEEMKE